MPHWKPIEFVNHWEIVVGWIHIFFAKFRSYKDDCSASDDRIAWAI
jgi:hypothetical protein